MRYRLVGTVEGRAVELNLVRGVSVLGSGEASDVHLVHPSVSRKHAELKVTEGGVELRDLGSKNGSFIGDVRIVRRLVKVGEVVRFGFVSLRLEQSQGDDQEAAVVLERSNHGPREVAGLLASQTTAGVNPFADFSRETLPSALRLLVAGAGLVRVAQTVGNGLTAALNVTLNSIVITSERGTEKGILYQQTHPVRQGCEPTVIAARQAGVVTSATLSSPRNARVFEPLLDAATSLVALAQREARVSETPPHWPAAARPEPATTSPEVAAIYEEATQVARTDIGVLIAGESGTGKELLARFVHSASRRATGPFVALNCASLPRDLLEAELFGIERGVATGVEPRAGKFELADEGTLFLDEIGDMQLETQAMILRVLQEGEVSRIGSTRARKVSVRVLAATNQDVDALLAEGRFRSDLFYRIASWRVSLPPLRERRDDIVNLAVHFLAEEAARNGSTVRGVSRGALDRLLAYDWPGNIRQLKNEMARAAAFVPDGGLLDTSRLSPDVLAGPCATHGAALADRLRTFERREITRVLLRLRGDTAAAAQALGMPRSTLYRRMRVLGIDVSHSGASE